MRGKSHRPWAKPFRPPVSAWLSAWLSALVAILALMGTMAGVTVGTAPPAGALTVWHPKPDRVFRAVLPKASPPDASPPGPSAPTTSPPGPSAPTTSPPGPSVPTTSPGQPQRTGGVKPFAIYYGWPSDVNGANGNVARSVAAFAGYSLVVFGEGNVLPGADALAGPVIAGVAAAGAVPYGYVDLGVTNGERNWTIAQMSTYMADWSALGAKGIFLDCAGADYGVSRARFDDAVNAAHDRGLRVIANAWNPDDVLSGSSPLGPGDGYLGENDVIASGVSQPIGAYEAKLAIMSAYAHSLGVAMYETATFAPRSSDTVKSEVADQALAALAPYDVSGFQLTDPQYSSVDNRLRPASSW